MSANLKSYAFWLWALFGLFCFRVISQLVQTKFNLPFLPAFDAWHSGALPYQYLVLIQVLIIFVCGYICLQFTSGKVVPRKRIGMLLLSLGILYASAMATRLFIGLFISSSPWFHAYLPIFFHFVLASFLIIAGTFHLRHSHGHG